MWKHWKWTRCVPNHWVLNTWCSIAYACRANLVAPRTTGVEMGRFQRLRFIVEMKNSSFIYQRAADEEAERNTNTHTHTVYRDSLVETTWSGASERRRVKQLFNFNGTNRMEKKKEKKEQRIRGFLCVYITGCIIERTDKGQVFVFSQHDVGINNNDNRQSGRGQTTTVSVHKFFIEKYFLLRFSICFLFCIRFCWQKPVCTTAPNRAAAINLLIQMNTNSGVLPSHDSMKLWWIFLRFLFDFSEIAIIFELLFILAVQSDWSTEGVGCGRGRGPSVWGRLLFYTYANFTYSFSCVFAK